MQESKNLLNKNIEKMKNPSFHSKLKKILKNDIKLSKSLDIKYLFNINDQKVFIDIKNTLSIIKEKGTIEEKQIINLLENKSSFFNDSIIAINSYLKFKDIFNLKLKNFEFYEIEEKILFLIYFFIKNTNYNLLCKILKNLKFLSLENIYLIFKYLKIEKIKKIIFLNFKKDLILFQKIINEKENFYFLIKVFNKFTRKDKLLILKLKIDHLKLIKEIFKKDCRKFLKIKDHEIFEENMKFNELCITNFLRKNDIFEKLKMAWCRIFLITRNYYLFNQIFKKLKNNVNNREYLFLRKIFLNLNSRKPENNILKQKFIDKNEFANIRIDDLKKIFSK